MHWSLGLKSRDVKDLAESLSRNKHSPASFKHAITHARTYLARFGREVVLSGVHAADAHIEGIELTDFSVQRVVHTEDGTELKSFACHHRIQNSDFEGGHFVDCRFARCKISQTSFKGCVFVRCRFMANEMNNVDFEGAVLIDCVVARNNMQSVSLKGVTTRLTGARPEVKEYEYVVYGLNADTTFQANTMVGVDLSGAYLGETFTTDLFNEKPSLLKSKRPKLLGYRYPANVLNNLQSDARRVLDDWEQIVGRDRQSEDYMQLLVCFNTLATNVQLLTPKDLNALFNKKFLKNELKSFRDTHVLILKTLHREAFYKDFLWRSFRSFGFPSDLIGLIYQYTGRAVPTKPFLHRKKLRREQRAARRNGNEK